MSNPVSEGVNASINWLGKNVNSANKRQSTPIKSDEVLIQIRVVMYPLTKELKILCDWMKDLRQGPLRRSEKLMACFQGSSRTPNHCFDSEGTRYQDKKPRHTFKYEKKIMQESEKNQHHHQRAQKLKFLISAVASDYVIVTLLSTFEQLIAIILIP